jgi:hypothetical protein
MPAQQLRERHFAQPAPPKMWSTSLWYWIHQEGLRWGIYWAIRSRWINAVAKAAYEQRIEEYERAI